MKTSLQLILVIVLAIFGLTWYFLGHSTEDNENNNPYTHYLPEENPLEFRDYWSDYSKTNGLNQAWIELENKFSNTHPNQQHLAAHLMGEITYEQTGLPGIADCSPNFGFGCHHGFISTAISELGEVAVNELDQVCIDKFAAALDTENCQHGIGHGILEYLGHNNSNQAVALCAKVNDVFPSLGCNSGVFMEYFHPLSDTNYSEDLTPTFNPSDPYNVCDDVSPEVTKTCLFEIHGWWRDAGNLNPQEIGNLCDVQENENRFYCYFGYGNFLAPQFDYGVDASKQACEKVASKEGSLMCKAGAMWRINFNRPWETAVKICESESPTTISQCLEYASLTCELEGTCKKYKPN